MDGRIVSGVRHIVNASGQLIGYRNPVTDQDESLVSGGGNGSTFVGMGHSRIAQAFNGGSFPSLSFGYPTIITQMLGQRITWLASYAVVGNTVAQVISTQLPQLQALSTKPDYVLMEIGYNDFSVGATAAAVQAQYAQLLTAINGLGIKVVAVTDSPGTTLTASQQLQQQTFNAWLVGQGRANKSLIVVDGYSCVVGTAADGSAGGMHSTMRQSDGIHHNPNGAMAIARELFTVLDPIIPKRSIFGAGASAAAQLVYNPNADGDNASGANGWTAGAGVTGNGPSYWNAVCANATATTSSVARSASSYAPQNKTGALLNVAASITANDGTVTVVPATTTNIRFIPFANGATVQLGYRVMPTVDNGAGYVVTTAGTLGAADDSATWSTTPGAVVQSGAGTARLTVVEKIVPGDTVVFVAEVFGAVTGGSGGVYAQLAAFTSAFGNLGSTYGGRLNIGTYGPNAGYMPPSMVLQTAPFTLPTNTGIVQPQVVISGTNGAAITAQIGACMLRKVS
jgi:lysophospholipase L1-like esterase